MRAYSYLFGIVCLNAAVVSLALAGVFTSSIPAAFSTTDILNMFAISVFDISLAVGGGALLGIVTAMFKTYTFAAGAVALWVVMILFKPVQLLITGFPILLNNFIYSVAPSLSWIGTIITVFVTMSVFVLFLEVMSGKQII